MKTTFFLIFSIAVLVLDVVLAINYPDFKAIRTFVQFVFCFRLLSYFMKIDHQDTIFSLIKWLIAFATVLTLLVFKVSSKHELADMALENITYIIDAFLIIPVLVNFQKQYQNTEKV